MFYVVDRIQDDVAELVGDDYSTFTVPRRQLPMGTRQGSVFRLTQDLAGEPDWTMAELDEVERSRRLTGR